MNTIETHPISREEIFKTRTIFGRVHATFSLLQMVPADSRPPVADTRPSVDVVVTGNATRSNTVPEGTATLKKVLAEIYSKDPERKKRDMVFKKKMFAQMKEYVKTGKMSPIKYARIINKVDQKELARRLGMKASNLCRMEKPGKNHTTITLQRVAKALSIPVGDLIHE
jgi:DNA-binding Xre family transcriptional regulator